jgi:hypothetical protein
MDHITPGGSMRAFPPAAATRLSLRESRIRASFLLKDLRSGDPFRTQAAVERLRLLPPFAAPEAGERAAQGGTVRLKHALEVVAREQGYPDWPALKAAAEQDPEVMVDTRRFFRRPAGGFLNRWFARYEDARRSLDTAGGYLFPYGEQFVVCEAGLLEHLGLDPAHPGWDEIGRDWVHPADPEALRRLESYVAEQGFAG